MVLVGKNRHAPTKVSGRANARESEVTAKVAVSIPSDLFQQSAMLEIASPTRVVQKAAQPPAQPRQI
jgi:hypothetical protein